jgi:hypothetical protein
MPTSLVVPCGGVLRNTIGWCVLVNLRLIVHDNV